MINPVNSFSQNKDNKTKCPDCESELFVPATSRKEKSLVAQAVDLNSKLKKLMLEVDA